MLTVRSESEPSGPAGEHNTLERGEHFLYVTFASSCLSRLMIDVRGGRKKELSFEKKLANLLRVEG